MLRTLILSFAIIVGTLLLLRGSGIVPFYAIKIVPQGKWGNIGLDAVKMEHVLGYLDDPVALYQDCWNLLRPGGAWHPAEFIEHKGHLVLEGALLGGISFMYNSLYDCIVTNAIFLTVGILLALLTAYRSGIIKPTENFKLGIFAATGGIALVYFVNFIMGFFGSSMGIMQIDNASPLSIGFSIVVVIIAALNLVLDFDFIEEGSENGAPKYMEWYGAFGLLVTLIWLYLEILRLLAKLNSRR